MDWGEIYLDYLFYVVDIITQAQPGVLVCFVCCRGELATGFVPSQWRRRSQS